MPGIGAIIDGVVGSKGGVGCGGDRCQSGSGGGGRKLVLGGCNGSVAGGGRAPRVAVGGVAMRGGLERDVGRVVTRGGRAKGGRLGAEVFEVREMDLLYGHLLPNDTPGGFCGLIMGR